MNGRPCRWCGAPLRWVITDKGARMPLNPDPDPTGNVYLHQGRARVMTATDMIPAGQRWMPHAARCPARPRKGTR